MTTLELIALLIGLAILATIGIGFWKLVKP
jgi:hypothetical protein